MDWKEKKYEPRTVIVSAACHPETSEAECSECGDLFCPERSFLLRDRETGETLRQEDVARRIGDAFVSCCNEDDSKVRTFVISTLPCRRTGKQPAIPQMAACIGECDNTCARCLDTAKDSGTPTPRGLRYTCRLRADGICGKFTSFSGETMTCAANDASRTDCLHHELAYMACRKPEPNAPCKNLQWKYSADGKEDQLYLLAHEVSAAKCRYLDVGLCTKEDCPQAGAACAMEASGEACADYIAAEGWNTGVFTMVSSADGKDDRKIFNSGSSYAFTLDDVQKQTLCLACRISHSVARATGLKCGGVRRSTTHPYLKEDAPMKDRSIVISYFYLTNAADCSKCKPDQLAKAVYEAVTKDCESIGCEETETCYFNR